MAYSDLDIAGGLSRKVNKVAPMRTRKDVLAHALRDLRIAPQATMVYEAFPDLEGVSEALAWTLSDRLVFPTVGDAIAPTPLLYMCLKYAFEWLNYEATRDNPTMRTAQTAYLAGLLFNLPELNNLLVEADGARWDPLKDVPFCEWLPEHPGVQMTTLPQPLEGAVRDDRMMRMLMLERLIKPTPVARLECNIASVLLPPDNLRPPRSFYGR